MTANAPLFARSVTRRVTAPRGEGTKTQARHGRAMRCVAPTRRSAISCGRRCDRGEQRTTHASPLPADLRYRAAGGAFRLLRLSAGLLPWLPKAAMPKGGL